jgi:SusD/RagB-like outer membrane lipoprotein
MKKTIYILFATIFLHSVIGCETVDFGDLNKNINGPSDPYPAGLLSGSIMSYATYTGRNGLMKPTLYMQYQAQVTYVDEMLYASVAASWYTYYVRSLSGLQLIIDFLGDPANITPAIESQGAIENQIGVAMILKSVIFKRVTDTYGDVPYSQALLGVEGIIPAYDSQADIYTGIVADTKAGRDMLDNSKSGPTGDIIYGGDVDSWVRFANSFLLQVTLQMSNTSSATSARTEFNAALTHPGGLIENVDEEAWFSYEDISGFRNPWNANRTPDYFVTQEFMDAMQGLGGALNPTSNTTPDDRRSVYTTDGDGLGVPYGHADGSGASAESISNDNYWNNVTPLPLLTASYTYLNRAEAAAISWTSENATAMLSDGITKSYETLDAHFGTDISSSAAVYAAARVADAGTVVGGVTQVIGEEKWVSLFGQAYDSWSEWRRTGYPTLIPGVDYFNDGNIPTRYIYPSEEASLNGSNYDSGVAGLSPAQDQNTAKVWWQQ